MQRFQIVAMFQALLFRAGAPLAKLLPGEVQPITLAAFLYPGSDMDVLLFKMLQRGSTRAEAQIQRADWKWLAGSVFAGGVDAPIVRVNRRIRERSAQAIEASLRTVFTNDKCLMPLDLLATYLAGA